ncbi:hypothetical protein AB4865_10595 [Capnocytophaga sp. ARDL2]|uniref:hypothetical protein n=1 Tax=Capnocytophaga sp. ARDL2 TaxID=3238809 RepID=UPI00355688E0
MGTSITPYAIEPRVGINLLNAIVIHTGYALPTENKKQFNGITFGIRWNTPMRSQIHQGFTIISKWDL